MTTKRYKETFDDGPGGWIRIIDNIQPPAPLQIQDGVVRCNSPWWVDYNHAPPGGGYLHLLMCLNTKAPFTERVHDVGGPNHFVQGGFSRNLTNAKITVRCKGELELRGANVSLLIQGVKDGKIAGWVLTGQPISVETDWTEQTITAVPDERQWTALGSRHDRTDMYGIINLATILSDVNVNIYLALFPLAVEPMGPIAGDPHVLRAGRDYPLWQKRLPEGYVLVDTVEITYP